VVLIHDIAVRHHDFGAWKVWEEVSRIFPSFSFHHSNGLGVLINSKDLHFDNPYLEALCGGGADPKDIRDYYLLCAERLEFEYRARAARFTVCRVYFPGAMGYSESESSSVEVPFGEWVTVDFDVPASDGSLRLDPAAGEAVIEIADIGLKSYASGEMLWQATNPIDQISCGGTAKLIPVPDTLLVLSYGSDPQLYLPALDASVQTDFLCLHFRIRIHENDSLVEKLLEQQSLSEA
jgi:hypothetical protein